MGVFPVNRNSNKMLFFALMLCVILSLSSQQEVDSQCSSYEISVSGSKSNFVSGTYELFEFSGNRSSYKHESKDLYLYYSDRTEGRRWLVDAGSWYLDESKRNAMGNAGYIYARTSYGNGPPTGTGMSWGSAYQDDPSVDVECLDQACGEAPAECWTEMVRRLCEAISQPTTTVVGGRSWNPTCDPAMKSFEMMTRGLCDGLFGAEYTGGSTTASSCVASGGSCYDSESGISSTCCSGLTCRPSTSSDGIIGICEDTRPR